MLELDFFLKDKWDFEDAHAGTEGGQIGENRGDLHDVGVGWG